MDPISSIRINFGLVVPFKNALICGEYWRSILFIWRRQFGISFDVLTVFSSRNANKIAAAALQAVRLWVGLWCVCFCFCFNLEVEESELKDQVVRL